MYVAYIVIMYFNNSLERFFTRLCPYGPSNDQHLPEAAPLVAEKRNYSHSNLDVSNRPENVVLTLETSDNHDDHDDHKSTKTFSRIGSVMHRKYRTLADQNDTLRKYCLIKPPK